MKTTTLSLISAILITGICSAQTPDPLATFDREWEESTRLALARYPASSDANSPLGKKMIEMNMKLEASNDPLFYSSNKPLLLAQKAAQELRISPVDPFAQPVSPQQTPNPQAYDRTKPFPDSDKSTMDRWGYKSVSIRSVEPDGVRIMHESGAAKFPIEKLTELERIHYGITIEGANQYRQQIAKRDAAIYAKRREAAQQAETNRRNQEAQMELEKQQAAAKAANVGPVVWKRYVNNQSFQSEYAADIANEIRLMDGAAAAERFRQEQQLKAQQGAKRIKDNEIVTLTTTEPIQGGGVLQKTGDRILLNGGASGGYRIDGDKLYWIPTGEQTHTRGGNSWIPVTPNGVQIIDPQ